WGPRFRYLERASFAPTWRKSWQASSTVASCPARLLGGCLVPGAIGGLARGPDPPYLSLFACLQRLAQQVAAGRHLVFDQPADNPSRRHPVLAPVGLEEILVGTIELDRDPRSAAGPVAVYCHWLLIDAAC